MIILTILYLSFQLFIIDRMIFKSFYSLLEIHLIMFMEPIYLEWIPLVEMETIFIGLNKVQILIHTKHGLGHVVENISPSIKAAVAAVIMGLDPHLLTFQPLLLASLF